MKIKSAWYGDRSRRWRRLQLSFHFLFLIWVFSMRKSTRQQSKVTALIFCWFFFRGAVAGGSGGACTENYLVNLPALFNGLALCYVKQNVLGKVRLLWSCACFFSYERRRKRFFFFSKRENDMLLRVGKQMEVKAVISSKILLLLLSSIYVGLLYTGTLLCNVCNLK